PAIIKEPQPPPPDPYVDGMLNFRAGNIVVAREKFHETIQNDPHHARAHFRLAEIALFARNFPHAEEQTRLPLRGAERLTEREQALARLVRSVAARNRFEAERIRGEIRARWPYDPDLARIEQSFPLGARRQGRRF